VPWNVTKSGLGFIGKAFTSLWSAIKVLFKAGRKAEYADAASTAGRKDVPGLTLIRMFMPSSSSGTTDVNAVFPPPLPTTRKLFIKRISHGAPHTYLSSLVM